MPLADYSSDVFDYLADMPGLPSRADRDALVDQGVKDPTQAHRVRIWDYFFPMNPEYIGKPQLKEIETLNEKRTAHLRHARNRFTTLMAYSLALLIIGLFVRYQTAFPNFANYGWIGVGIGVPGALLTLGWFALRRRRINNQTNRDIFLLEQMIRDLKALVPAPPSDDQIDEWLEQDFQRLGNIAVTKTSPTSPPLENEEIQILRLPAHAKLQDALTRKKFLPMIQPDSDFEKHLEAIQSANFINETFDIFYGIYFIEFFVMRDKILGNFGCFFDFITGKTYGEHTKETYYNDIVALGIRFEYQQPRLTWLTLPRIALVIFSISLKSGERVQVILPSEEYLAEYANSHNQRLWLPVNWTRNPAKLAEQVVTKLREKLAPHKI